MKHYIIEYRSDSNNGGSITSTSSNAIKHGQELLGSAGGGVVTVKTFTGEIVGKARYTPELGGCWYNCLVDWPN